MKLLVITNLFPNNLEPVRGVYNMQLVTELARLCDLRVIAPLPWSPYYWSVPEAEVIDGIEVSHPRYFMTPKIGRVMYGFYFFLSLYGKVKRDRNNFKFDVILASWAFPDGVGSYFIAKCLRIPIVIQVLGSDINIYTKTILRRKLIAYVLKRCSKVLSVSQELKNRIAQIGVPVDKVRVVNNGVNQSLFSPMDRTLARNSLKLPQETRIILYVGNLVPVKGIDGLVSAYGAVASEATNSLLIIIGDGFLKKSVLKKVKDLNLEGRVILCGKRPHNEIPAWMNASDLLCLPSLNEGSPNVILEAMACGVPIVATRVGGIPEMVRSYKNVKLTDPKDIKQLSEAILKFLSNGCDQQASLDKPSNRSWKDAANDVLSELYRLTKEQA